MSDERTGPVEDFAWPARLSARVASTDGRIHGYSVRGDLAEHYSQSEQALLTLTGELPDEPAARAFEWATQVLGATSVAEAPVHTAIVARLCGAAPAAAYAAGFTALTEQATDLVDRHDALLAWLNGEAAVFPEAHVSLAGADRALVDEARRAIGELDVPALERSPASEAALIAILHRAGLRDRAQLVAAVALARLPVLMAETIAQRPLAFRGYPMDLPDFVVER